MVETSSFNLIVVNLLLIQGRPIIIKNWGISVMNKRVNYKMQLKRANGIYTKWVTGPEPVGFPSKPCKKMALINEMKRILCWSAYDLSIKTSPVAPVSNKVERFSDFPLILIVHREIKCLFETSTEFAGVKVLRPQVWTRKVCRERLPKFALGSLGKRSGTLGTFNTFGTLATFQDVSDVPDVPLHIYIATSQINSFSF